MFEYLFKSRSSVTLCNMDKLAPAKTRTDETYDRMRADILGGHWKPGDRLKFAPLGERYSVSVGVIREVLGRLAEQGLVRAEPQIGFWVTPISTADLQDLTAVRVDIEGLALRYSIQRGNLDWETRLVAAHHALERTQRINPEDPTRLSDDWVVAHAHFHDVLLSGCGSPRLHAIARSVRDTAELYRRWSVPLGEEKTRRDVEAEHREILNAALDRDADRAVAALTKHINVTTQLVLGQEAVEA
jgi:DNA-binding GntR family transcriptional regulator